MALVSPRASTEALFLARSLFANLEWTGSFQAVVGEEAPLAGVPNLALRAERAPNASGAELPRLPPRLRARPCSRFLLGSFATAFFLYGVALLYGATGTTRLEHMAATAQPGAQELLHLGLALVLVGLSFKVAAAPFQLWTPDVYQGAPTPVTALMASGPKAAAFALLLRILLTVDAAGTVLVLGAMDFRGADDGRGKSGGAGADQHQAHAGV